MMKNQFLAKILKEIATYKKMKKEDQIKFHLKLAEKPTPTEESELTMEYMRKK
jgi:hypothetical protein